VTPVDAAVTEALGASDPVQLAEIMAALKLLAGRLPPRVTEMRRKALSE
jgi:hypothetical protein